MFKTIITLALCFSFLYSNSQNCPLVSNTIMFNDSNSSAFKMMTSIDSKPKETCNTYEFNLVDTTNSPASFDIIDVYALSFFYQSSSKTKITFSYASGSNWSKENTIELKASPGEYHSIPLVIFANRFEFDISSLSRVKIKVESDYVTQVDEINFNYTNNKSETKTIEELKVKLKKMNHKHSSIEDKEHQKRWARDRGNIKG